MKKEQLFSAPKGLLERVDVADIRKNAEYVGEFNISDDDIKYGLMYGRSVIAEFFMLGRRDNEEVFNNILILMTTVISVNAESLFTLGAT